MGDLLPHVCIEGMYHISVEAFAKSLKQLESPTSWQTTDLLSQMTGLKKEIMKPQISIISIPVYTEETSCSQMQSEWSIT